MKVSYRARSSIPARPRVYLQESGDINSQTNKSHGENGLGTAKLLAGEECLPSNEANTAHARQGKRGDDDVAVPGVRLGAGLLDGKDEQARAAEQRGTAEKVDASEAPPRDQAVDTLGRPAVGYGQERDETTRKATACQ